MVRWALTSAAAGRRRRPWASWPRSPRSDLAARGPSCGRSGRSRAYARGPHRYELGPRFRPLAESSGLLTIAAGGHRAPPARVVARHVEEGPATGGGAAQLEATPVFVRHRAKYRRDHSAHRPGHSVRLGLQPGPAIGTEARPQPAGSGRFVERGDVEGVDLAARVGADQASDGLPQCDRVFQICFARGRPWLDEAVCNQPGLQCAWVGELLWSVLQVDGVDEGLNQSDNAGCVLSIGHLKLEYTHNLQITFMSYNNSRTG